MTIQVDELNEILTTDNLIEVVESLGGVISNTSTDDKGTEYTIFSSICHHVDAEHHKSKLYLNHNKHTFYCYSCSNSFNIYTLVKQRKSMMGEDYNFPQILQYVCDICGIPYNGGVAKPIKKKNDSKELINKLQRYTQKGISSNENKIYDKQVLYFLEEIYHQSFIDDGIPISVQEQYGIKFYQYCQQICIPVYDESANFIGVHCRNLLPHMIDNGYKYLPLKLLDGTEYKFSTSNVLFGLNVNKINIQNLKTAILVESPKCVMQLESILESNISCGLFGMNCGLAKRDILLKIGIEHIVIALDKQYHSMLDEDGNKTDEFLLYEKKILKIRDLWIGFATVSVMYDDIDLLDYKDSPTDKGKEIWDVMWKEKEIIYEL